MNMINLLVKYILRIIHNSLKCINSGMRLALHIALIRMFPWKLKTQQT